MVQSFAIKMSFTSAGQLLPLAAIIFGCAALLAAGVRLTNLWLNGRLAAAVGSDGQVMSAEDLAMFRQRILRAGGHLAFKEIKQAIVLVVSFQVH